MCKDQRRHVVIFPSPGMGHLIPLLELAKQIVGRHHHLSATIIIPTSGPPTEAQKAILEALPKNVNHIFLPLVDLPEGIHFVSQIFLTVTHSIPSLREALMAMTTTNRLVAVVMDPFCLDALENEVKCEYRDMKEPITFPGCVPIHGKDLPDPVHDRSNIAYKLLLEGGKRFNSVDGILLNSFLDLEEGAIKALQVEEPDKPAIYTVGPLIQTRLDDGSDRVECLRWLDDQPSGSVIFVAFGSGGTLSQDQLNELAFGLDMSGQRFLWVVKGPNNKSSNDAYFGVESPNDPLSFLPKGFLERTKGQGLAVPFWAPQIEVLSHGSTGGFLIHSGWNSILESVAHGVPMITWPLYAEQKMNSVMLTEGLGVALRPKANENGLVGREEVVGVIKNLMGRDGGNEIRLRMNNLKDAAARVLAEDGSSTKSINELVLKWENK
ncbi:Hydroquinone glucosyltransferase [Bertholletia excelsa]